MGRNINSKVATKNAGCKKKKKSGKESQNNETEVTTEIKKGKNIFMLQHQIPCHDHISGHNINFEVATKRVQKSIKVDFKTSHFGRPSS